MFDLIKNIYLPNTVLQRWGFADPVLDLSTDSSETCSNKTRTTSNRYQSIEALLGLHWEKKKNYILKLLEIQIMEGLGFYSCKFLPLLSLFFYNTFYSFYTYVFTFLLFDESLPWSYVLIASLLVKSFMELSFELIISNDCLKILRSTYLLWGFLGTNMGNTPPITPKIALNKMIGKIDAPILKS